MNTEPTLEEIEDYNDQESNEKRKTVKFIVIGLLVVSAIYGTIKFSFNSVDDYIGTSENPGINTAKH